MENEYITQIHSVFIQSFLIQSEQHWNSLFPMPQPEVYSRQSSVPN